MKKIELQDIVKNKQPRFLSEGETAITYKLSDGKIFKHFKRGPLLLLKSVSVDIEQKVLAAKNIKINPAIIKPENIVYHNGFFEGYTMKSAKGIDYNTWENSLTTSERKDLYGYAHIHSQLESIVKSTPNIVYPDLCTCDNIYINGSSIQLIDYDGLQIDNNPSISISTTLGPITQYIDSKKYRPGILFTKELDKKSLILLYFLTTFNINLNNVGKIDSTTGKPITLDDIFRCINLNDYDMMNKVWKIFQDNKDNEYLGDDVFRIAEEHQMEITPLYNNLYFKRLVRK
ncbi:MAG: hypothetical protein IJ509_00450 [Bacilli bacterium]|nr:hypothetical protein [Bacilli bacterium]